MSQSEIIKLERWMNGLVVAFLLQAAVIAYAAGGVSTQVAQHEEWKKDASPKVSTLWNEYENGRKMAKLKQENQDFYP